MFGRTAKVDLQNGIVISVFIYCDPSTPRRVIIERAQKQVQQHLKILPFDSEYWEVVGMEC